GLVRAVRGSGRYGGAAHEKLVMTGSIVPPMSKRDLLALIGKTAGASAMYMAMNSFGQAQASTFKAPVKLDGDPKGATVLILGAGVAGATAALELSRAGYKVQ